MDIILIQTEIHIKMKCLWRSPPDTESMKVKSFRLEGKKKKETERGKINFL